MLEVKMYDDVEFRKRNEKFGHKKIEFIEIEMDPGNWSTLFMVYGPCEIGPRGLVHGNGSTPFVVHAMDSMGNWSTSFMVHGPWVMKK